MSDELKNCPHCGNNDYVMVKRVEGETVSPDNFQVVCNWLSCGCGASGGVRRTESEAIAAWNNRADDAPEQPVDNAQADSRERLEADIAASDHPFAHTPAGFRDIKSWLDRQAAITRREFDGECEFCQSEVARLQEHVDSLTAELDKANESGGKLFDRLIDMTAERDELQSIIDHMPKTEQECEACQEAHDRLMFNAKADMDNLRDELKHKQLVIDRQRDSFAKMEREYRELQDMCGELERTIENLRGD